MFIRQCVLDNIKLVDAVSWNSRKAGAFDTEKFAFDKENYVYFRARIMTANVPNGNGDYFHKSHKWGGIKEAYLTMVGKPLDKDHDCDSVDKIKGKVIDVVPIETEKEYYLEGLIAADKRTDPDFCRKIEDGAISSVSMSCLVEKAQCSECGNIAHNPDELCSHMKPMTGCKGKRVEATDKNPFGVIYEINFGINFTGLGAVTVPADPTARIFEVWSNLKDSKKLEGLTLPEYEKLLTCASEISQIISTALNKNNQLTATAAKKTEDKKKEEDETEDDDSESKSKIVKITEKTEDEPKDEPESVPAPVEIQPVIIGNGFSLVPSTKYPGLLEVEDRGALTGVFVEQILENVGEAEKVFRYQEKLGLIKQETKKEVSRMDLKLSYIPGKTLETSFISASENDREYKVTVAEIAPLDVQQAIVAGDKKVMSPDEMIAQIKAECSDLFSFKRYMRKQRRDILDEQASLESKKKDDEDKKKKEDDDKKKADLEAAELEAKKKEKEEKEMEDKKKEKADLIRQKVKTALRRKCQQIPEGFSMNPSEIEKPAKVNEDLTVAINEKEFEKIKAPKMESSPVKQYYGRLPSNAPGAVQRALNPTEASVKELQVKLAEQQKELDLAKKALEEEKTKNEKQEKGKLIYDIVATMKKRDMVASEKEDELIGYLGSLENEKLSEFAKVLNISGKVTEASVEEVADGNLAHVVETIEENEDAVERLSKIMNKK